MKTGNSSKSIEEYKKCLNWNVKTILMKRVLNHVVWANRKDTVLSKWTCPFRNEICLLRNGHNECKLKLSFRKSSNDVAKDDIGIIETEKYAFSYKGNVPSV